MDIDVYRVHKVCQCAADDEFYRQTGYEPEQIEIFLFYNKQMVKDMRSERSASYDYLQKGDNLSQSDDGSQRLNGSVNEADALG